MNFSLNLDSVNSGIYVLPILVHIVLGLAIIISFLFAKKFMNKELHKPEYNNKLNRAIALAFGATLLALTILVFVHCMNIVLEHCWGRDYVLCKPCSVLAAFFSLVLIFSYALTIPTDPHLRFFDMSNEDAFTMYRKFIRLATISFCIMSVASITTKYEYFFSVIAVVYYFLEMAVARKLIAKILKMRIPPQDPFLFKLIAHIDDKIIFLCLIGMFWVVSMSPQQSDSLFFENLKNIYCVIFVTFLTQALISRIADKFIEQLDFIKGGMYTQLSIQKRQKNLIFICNVIVTIFYLSVACVLLECMGINLWSHIFYNRAITIGGIIFATIVIYKGFDEFSDTVLEKAGSSNGNAKYKVRLQTFLPIVSVIFYVILFVTSALLVLANLGINIAPILATFTVFSAAIGLAAQEIIRSFLHGITFLIEEDLYVGAYMSINGMDGVIEKLSARVLYLRGDDGALHTIPYNVVNIVTNHSKNYSYYYGELQVSNKDNIEEISKILHRVIDDMQKEKNYRNIILGKAEIFGLKPFDLSGIKIFWRIKTSPDEKGVIAKYDIYSRVYSEYKKRGICVPTVDYLIKHC